MFIHTVLDTRGPQCSSTLVLFIHSVLYHEYNRVRPQCSLPWIIVAGHGLGPACHVQVRSVVRSKYVPGAPFCCVTAHARYAPFPSPPPTKVFIHITVRYDTLWYVLIRSVFKCWHVLYGDCTWQFQHILKELTQALINFLRKQFWCVAIYTWAHFKGYTY